MEKSKLAGVQIMDKARLIKLIQQGNTTIEALLRTLDSYKMEEPGVYDDLSFKDVLAHITAWERMETGWLRASLKGEEVIRYTPEYRLGGDNEEQTMHDLNAAIFAQNRERSLGDVLTDFRQAHTDLLETVRGMSEEDLNDPRRFDWYNGKPIWQSIAGNSYEHIREHRELVDKWLNSSPV